MTRHLEEVFDLDPMENNSTITSTEKTILDIMSMTDLPTEVRDKIDAALQQIHGLNDDSDINELISTSKQSYHDLMDLGNNLEARFSGKIFEVATQMLRNAIDLQIHKNDKKLRVIDLQIKKKRIDIQEQLISTVDNSIPGQARILDRNALLKANKESRSTK